MLIFKKKSIASEEDLKEYYEQLDGEFSEKFKEFKQKNNELLQVKAIKPKYSYTFWLLFIGDQLYIPSLSFPSSNKTLSSHLQLFLTKIFLSFFYIQKLKFQDLCEDQIDDLKSKLNSDTYHDMPSFESDLHSLKITF